MPYKKLLSGVSTTGASTAYVWYGGPGTFTVDAVGGGAVTLQQSPDGTTYEAVHLPNSTGTVAISTGDGSLPFRLSGPVTIRAVVTTASSTPGVNVWIN